jgi:hypothetical protein
MARGGKARGTGIRQVKHSPTSLGYLEKCRNPACSFSVGGTDLCGEFTGKQQDAAVLTGGWIYARGKKRVQRSAIHCLSR